MEAGKSHSLQDAEEPMCRPSLKLENMRFKKTLRRMSIWVWSPEKTNVPVQQSGSGSPFLLSFLNSIYNFLDNAHLH